MKPEVDAPLLVLAIEILEEAKTTLEALPSTPEVRELQGRWYALRTAVHGIVLQRRPSRITATQGARLTRTVVAFALEVADAQQRVERART